jgi:hypothetical protein
MSVEIRVLGGLQVLVDDQQIPVESWRRRVAAVLVKLLAPAKGRRLHRDQVLDALWLELLIEQDKAAHYAGTPLGVHDSVVRLERGQRRRRSQSLGTALAALAAISPPRGHWSFL